MEKIKTTLHPKDSPNDELYPNVLPSNIPVGQGLINTGDKLSIDYTYIQGKLTNGVGINIDENNQISIADSVPKQVEYTQGVKTSKIVNTNGYTYLASDTSYVDVGNSSRLLQTYGSGSRPTYNGKDLALLSDSDTSHWDLLMKNLGIGRFANHTFYVWKWFQNNDVYDDLAPYYTDLTRYLENSGFNNTNEVYIINDFNTNVICNSDYMFAGFKNAKTLYMSSALINGGNLILDSSIEHLLIKDGCSVKIDSSNKIGFFTFRSSNIIEVGDFDLSNWCADPSLLFEGCINIKQIHCKHFKHSFNIHYSTKFEESDLVEILNNLDIVSTTQTLTMGTTNLAKLTTDDILIATGKGWQLA